VINTSISVGISSREPSTPDEDNLIATADAALYAAKRGGRDRCCVISAGGSSAARAEGPGPHASTPTSRLRPSRLAS
jgi:predicted signal transduction protein with EAL and GGDEF domain